MMVVVPVVFVFCFNNCFLCKVMFWAVWRCNVLKVSALFSELSSLGLSPGQGHCVVILGKTCYSHSASLHPWCINGYWQIILLVAVMQQKPEISTSLISPWPQINCTFTLNSLPKLPLFLALSVVVFLTFSISLSLSWFAFC